MLEVRHLSVSYGPHRALEDVSIKVDEGEICVILGANGAGKSSLLKAIAGLVRPMDGSRILMAGADITRQSPDRIVEAGLALVPEGRGIFGEMSVAENLQLGAYGRRARGSQAAHLDEVLQLFPTLGERRRQTVRTMSGGEQQMVAIARALMSNPAILMMDEPSLGLSPLLVKELFRSLKAVRETGVGILLVEQNARQSLAIAERGYLIENGRIVGEGRAAALATDPAVQAAYLGGAAADVSHLRLGEKPVAASSLPVPVAAAAGSPAALAERAALIHRRHIETIRTGGNVYGHHVGRVVALAPDNRQQREMIAMGTQADELSARAGDMARRAAEIHRNHVAALRAARLSELPPPAAVVTGLPVLTKTEGGRSLMSASEGKLGNKARKNRKKAKKLAKQAHKLAEKALRLMD